MEPDPSINAPWRAGWDAARRLLRPAVVLQAAALALVWSYYRCPSARPWFDQLAAAKASGGFAFSALSTGLFGGVLPFLYLRAAPAGRAPAPWGHLLFFFIFWALKGAEVDLLYRTLGRLYGNEVTVGTVVLKVLTDQFVYNPIYATPVGNLIFAWKDAGFRWGPVADDLRKPHWFLRRALPVQIAVWAIWIPVVSCVYALPPTLQIPLFDVVLCFWSLLFTHVTTRQNTGGS